MIICEGNATSNKQAHNYPKKSTTIFFLFFTPLTTELYFRAVGKPHVKPLVVLEGPLVGKLRIGM